MAEIKIKCPQCNKELQGNDAILGQEVQCASCNHIFKAEASAPKQSPPKLKVAEPAANTDAANDVKRLAASLSERITTFAGVEKLEGFSLKDLFSEVFRKHTREEIEDYFTVGTLRTTPSITDVDTSWPKPWVFFETFLGALIVYILFLSGWNEFGNLNLIPGLIMMGSFAVPLATLIFFVEINARRNVSLYQVIRLLFLGGILSLIFSLLFFMVTDKLGVGWLGASVAAFAEEPGKLLALFIVINLPKYRYRLNGLLFGAAVGTGFAAFESAGYAFRMGLHNTDLMKDTIMVRGMLSPFGHIAWTAMCGAALWRVKGDSKFAFAMVQDKRFLKVFGFAIVLHMLWNTPWNFPFYSKFVILGTAAWVLIFALIQDGLKELRDEKAKAIAGGNEDIPTNGPAIPVPGD
jgi:RsiW-degrading membrane proteinase PrsW (M82 family)